MVTVYPKVAGRLWAGAALTNTKAARGGFYPVSAAGLTKPRTMRGGVLAHVNKTAPYTGAVLFLCPFALRGVVYL